MANLTFSKKGVPMGRNKSTAENTSSRWTPEEDNYLRLAAEQNVSSRTVAAKLGRSYASVYTRKWQLDIKNNKSVPRKGAKRTSVKSPIATTTYATPKGIELFKIETGVPLPARNGRNEEARNQMREIFNQIKVGQSFVVPKNMVYVAQYIVNKEFQAYKLRTSATSADKKFFRIYRVA